eukprot:759483-Hanusia_phi.AAC.1
MPRGRQQVQVSCPGPRVQLPVRARLVRSVQSLRVTRRRPAAQAAAVPGHSAASHRGPVTDGANFY